VIALVLGSAECLHADIERARDLVDVDACMVVACNQAVAEWPGRLDHFATMHPEEMAPWLERRRGRGYPDGYETWTRPYPHGFKDRERMCDHVIGGWADGSSGMLALGVAIENGGTRNLLCGIPMDTGPLQRGCLERSGELPGQVGGRGRRAAGDHAFLLRLDCRTARGADTRMDSETV